MDIVKLTLPADPPSPRELGDLLKIDEDMWDEFVEVYERALQVANPKMLYGRCGVSLDDDGKTVRAGDMKFKSRVLHVNMKGISTAFPYVATGGRELHDLAASMPDPLSKYWVDSFAEAALRSALTHGFKEVHAREGTGTLYAMNPGSLPDWPISQQRPLFDLLGDVMGDIGVELTDSFLMMPVKSVSGLMFEAKEHYTNCSLCPREGCPGRREPYDPSLYHDKYGLGEN